MVHWISLSLLAGIIESLLFLFLGPQRELSDYVRFETGFQTVVKVNWFFCRANLREFYDLDVDKTVYVGWWYWKMENGNVNLSVDYLLKFLIMNISMVLYTMRSHIPNNYISDHTVFHNCLLRDKELF